MNDGIPTFLFYKYLYADATIDIEGGQGLWTEAWKRLQALIRNPNYSKQAAIYQTL